MVYNPNSLEEVQIGGWDEYGIDEEAPVPNIDSDNDIQVLEARIGLYNDHQNALSNSINPLNKDGNEGITLYCDAVFLILQ